MCRLLVGNDARDARVALRATGTGTEATSVLAIHWGFLEVFFASVLSALVLAVGAFALFVGIQLFRNPARRPR
jgi:hypothetical protein